MYTYYAEIVVNCSKIFSSSHFKDTTTYYTYMALQMFACTATQMCVMKVSGSVSGDADSFDRRLAFPFARVVLGPFVSPRFAFPVFRLPSHCPGRVIVFLPSFAISSRMKRTDCLTSIAIRSICSRPTDPECGFSVYYY